MRGRMRIFRVLGAAAIAAGLLVGAGTTPASAATPHPLRNHNSGKCLEIADWRTDNGAPARQWNSEGRQANMEWDYCYPWISCAW